MYLQMKSYQKIQYQVLDFFLHHLTVKFNLRSFRKRRSDIERCFGTLKMSYKAVGTRRSRTHRYQGGMICNITAALYNRRKMLFSKFRQILQLN